MQGAVRAVALASASALMLGLMASAPASVSAQVIANKALTIGSLSPTIINVVPGPTAESLTVNYRPFDPSVVNSQIPSEISYELSLDSTTWWGCEKPTEEQIALATASCTLTSLTPLRTYGVYIRALEKQELTLGVLTTTGSSPVAGPFIGTTEIPQGLDPDKPTKLPSPRTAVTANFNAASNSLGIDATRRAVGVGTLPKITFSSDIPNKGAIERHLVVSSQVRGGVVKPVAGAWGWVSERSVVFRPINYWPGNSTIRIVANLDKVVLGKSGSKFLVGAKKLDKTYQFNTARKFIARVDGTSKKMKVFVDGKRVQTFPVSLGKNEWETRNGTKVVSTSKEANKIYRSESLGLTAPEDQYELEAPWNTRLTPTGEFIHAAPWAYGRLGRYNGSHGCTNMYEADAEWIYKNTIPGDIVFYTNTGGNTVEPWNGPGGLWNIPWAKWKKKSALYSGTNSVETDTNAGTGSLETAKPASA